MKDLLLSLGAKYAHSADSHASSTTHFVYCSRKPRDGNRALRSALAAGKSVVHPAWLEACARTGRREHEQAYKWTMDASRSLSIGLEGIQRGTSVGMSRGNSAATERATTEEVMENGLVKEEDQQEQEDDEFALPPPLVHASSKSAPTANVGRSSPSRLISNSNSRVFHQIAGPPAESAVQATASRRRPALPLPRSPPPPSLPSLAKTDVARSASESQVSPARARKLPLAFALSQPHLLDKYTTAPSARFVESVPLAPQQEAGHSAVIAKMRSSKDAKGNDSGFVPSSTEKDKQQRLVLSSPPVEFGGGDISIPSVGSSSSSPHRKRVVSSSSSHGILEEVRAHSQSPARLLPEHHGDLHWKGGKISSSSFEADASTQQQQQQQNSISSTAVSRDIIAEMHALMAEQPATGSTGAGSALAPAASAQTLAAGGARSRRAFAAAAARRAPDAGAKAAYVAPIRYEGLFESQLQQVGTQFQEHGHGHEMKIRISEPSAEAAKARLLADIGAAAEAQKRGEGNAAAAAAAAHDEDSDATQKSSSGAESFEQAQPRRRTRRTAP